MCTNQGTRHWNTYPHQTLEHPSTPDTGTPIHTRHWNTHPHQTLEHLSTPDTGTPIHTRHWNTYPHQTLEHLSTPDTGTPIRLKTLINQIMQGLHFAGKQQAIRKLLHTSCNLYFWVQNCHTCNSMFIKYNQINV